MDLQPLKDKISDIFYVAKWIVIGLIVITLGTLLHYQYLSAETLDVTVSDINKGDFVSMCEVSDGKCNEYLNEDDLLWLKWDSGTVRAELAGAMQKGEAVKVKVHGYRIEVLSMRKKIIKMVE